MIKAPYKQVKRSLVFRPPIRLKPRDKPRKAAGGYVTAINLAIEKGGSEFKTLNLLMPDVQFLGVQGGYGSQKLHNVPNVRYMTNTTDMQFVYDNTSILVMFSKFEGLPTIALEAMSQGIPCVTLPIPGAIEACGEAGHYVSGPHEAVEKIRAILADYATHSRAALKQYRENVNCWQCLKDYFTQ